MQGDLKEVYFDEYCCNCKYFSNSESDEPCLSCLEEAGNTDSHKPMKYKGKSENARKKVLIN